MKPSVPAPIRLDDLALTDTQRAEVLEMFQSRIAHLAQGRYPTEITASISETYGQVPLTCDEPEFEEALKGVSKILRVLVAWRNLDRAVRAKVNAGAAELTLPVQLTVALGEAGDAELAA